MIDQKQVNKLIINGLKGYCGCEVVFANTNAIMPPYPFLSCTITTLSSGNPGTYCVDGDTHYREIGQVWSITAQSNNDLEALEIIYKARDFLENMGIIDLSENRVIPSTFTGITNRDSILTYGYEYRKGFDATFNLLDKVENPVIETIEKFEIQESDSDG